MVDNKAISVMSLSEAFHKVGEALYSSEWDKNLMNSSVIEPFSIKGCKGYYITAEEAEVLYGAEEDSIKKDLHYLAMEIGGVPVSKEAIKYTIDKFRYNHTTTIALPISVERPIRFIKRKIIHNDRDILKIGAIPADGDFNNQWYKRYIEIRDVLVKVLQDGTLVDEIIVNKESRKLPDRWWFADDKEVAWKLGRIDLRGDKYQSLVTKNSFLEFIALQQLILNASNDTDAYLAVLCKVNNVPFEKFKETFLYRLIKLYFLPRIQEELCDSRTTLDSFVTMVKNDYTEIFDGIRNREGNIPDETASKLLRTLMPISSIWKRN